MDVELERVVEEAHHYLVVDKAKRKQLPKRKSGERVWARRRLGRSPLDVHQRERFQ